jgi:hypothetical protein
MAEDEAYIQEMMRKEPGRFQELLKRRQRVG